MATTSQLKAIDLGWIPESFISTPAQHENPDKEICDALRPLLTACSMTHLRQQYPTIDVYFQASAYLDLCQKIMDSYFTYVLNMGSDIPESFETVELPKIQQLSRIMDFCANIRSQLDILDTIDHLPKGDELFELAYDGKSPIQVWRKFTRVCTQKDIRAYYNFQKPKALVDDASNLLRRMSLQSRRSNTVQRVLNAILTAHRNQWYVVFDTLTLSDDNVELFYKNKTALRDHFRNIGRLVLKAEHRSTKESYDDCFQYFCVPEYGSKEGRLHFHAVYIMRNLPIGTVDPNIGASRVDRRQVGTLQGLWPYGFSAPVAVRYQSDAFGVKRNWLWPRDKKTGKPIDSKPAIAVGYYVTKYVNKNTEQNSIRLNVTGKSWNNKLAQILQNLPTHAFRVRMSRGFGYDLPPMENLPMSSLLELTKLSMKVTPLCSLLKRNARKQIRSRLGALSLADIMAAKPSPTNLLKSLRRLMNATTEFNPQNFIDLMTPKLMLTDISNETAAYLERGKLLRAYFVSPTFTAGRK